MRVGVFIMNHKFTEMKYEANLGYQGGTAYSYPDETRDEFYERCKRIAMFARPDEIKIIDVVF